MPSSSPVSHENSHVQSGEKSLALAFALFPGEEWLAHEANIFVAKSRLTGGYKEQAKLYREIADACYPAPPDSLEFCQRQNSEFKRRSLLNIPAGEVSPISCQSTKRMKGKTTASTVYGPIRLLMGLLLS
jgi:hypothetical protein